MEGPKLKEYRKLRGLTQGALAKRLATKYTDSIITRDMIAAYEIGRTPIPEWFADRVAEEAAEYEIRKRIPIIGYVSAGETSVEYDDQGYPTGAGFDEVERPTKVKDPHAYALRVKGDSMEPVYKDGDTVILDTTKPVHDKDEAIVRIGGKTYFKIFRRIMGRVSLQSFNREHPEFTVDPADLHFAHRVVLIEPAERDLQDPLIGPALRHVYGSPAKDKAAGAITTPEEVPSPKAASDARPGVPGDTKTERFHGKKGRKK